MLVKAEFVFREAYNERFVGGIRFVDYYNLKPKSKTSSILDIDELYGNGDLELLSKIELENIQVNKRGLVNFKSNSCYFLVYYLNNK